MPVALGMRVWSSLLWGAALATPEALRLVAALGRWISVESVAFSPDGKTLACEWAL